MPWCERSMPRCRYIYASQTALCTLTISVTPPPAMAGRVSTASGWSVSNRQSAMRHTRLNIPESCIWPRRLGPCGFDGVSSISRRFVVSMDPRPDVEAVLPQCVSRRDRAVTEQPTARGTIGEFNSQPLIRELLRKRYLS